MRKLGNYTKPVSTGREKRYTQQKPYKASTTFRGAGAKVQGSRLGKRGGRKV